MKRTELWDYLTKISKDWMMTGSRFICTPPPTNTDEDYIIYGDLNPIEEALGQLGFKLTTDPEYEGGSWFLTFRLDEFNLIVTDSEVFFERFVAATLSARKKNLLKKEDRISHFKKILYGEVVGKSYSFGKNPPITEYQIPIIEKEII